MAATDGRDESVRVAVLGIGIMGSAMARNLVSAGLAHHDLGSVADDGRAAGRCRSAGDSVAGGGGPRMRTS